MTSAQLIQIIKSLTGESLRQAFASWLFPLLLIYCGLIITLAGTIRFTNIPLASDYESAERAPLEEAKRLGTEELKKTGVPLIQGEIQILFGSIKIPWVKFRENAVNYFETLLVFFTSDAAGIIFTLIWTAGFIPEFLQGFWWNMLRIRPISLTLLLITKTIAIFLVVLTYATILISGTWVALGFATGVWEGNFLWAIPILLLQFVCFFPVSIFLGTWTRSTTVAIFGSIAFWFICWLVNHARMNLFLSDASNSTSDLSSWFIHFSYWILPKPIDFSIFLSDLMGTMKEFPPPQSWSNAYELGKVIPKLSIVSSLISSAVVFWIACIELNNPSKE